MGSRMTHPRVELRYQKTIISIIKITNYHQQHHISSLATSLSSASTPFAFGGGGGAGGWVLAGCRLAQGCFSNYVGTIHAMGGRGRRS